MRASFGRVARLNLPNMRYDFVDRVDIHAPAVRGRGTLEPDPERWLKCGHFIAIYTAVDGNQRQRYDSEHPEKARTVRT